MSKNGLFDGLFNRIRQSIDVSVAIKITYYALFLKYIELKKLPCFKEQFSLSFLSVLYGDRIVEGDLIQYLHDAEDNLALSGSPISHAYSEVINRVPDKRIIKTILTELYQYDIDSAEKLVATFDELIFTDYLYTGKAADNLTNKALAKLEGSLLNAPDDTKIYDGYCGYGISVCEAAKDGAAVVIRDINNVNLSIAIINLLIHGKRISSAVCGDSNFDCDSKYKFIVSEPPFNVHRDDEYIAGLNSVAPITSKTAVEIERIISSLSEDGRAVILVPAGFLFRSSATAELRKRLLEQKCIEAVIEIPEGVINGVAIKSAILLVNKQKKNDHVMFVNTTNLWNKKSRSIFELSQEGINTILDVVQNQKVVDEISAVIDFEAIVNRNYNMIPSVYTVKKKSFIFEELSIKSDMKRCAKLEMELMEVSKELEKLRSKMD